MGDHAARLWLWRGAFVLAVAVMLFLRIMPLSVEAGSLPGPDLLMVLCCVWALRRPDHLPALLIAGAVLVEDMLLMRAPGLWTAIMVMGTEFLRSRSAFSRELTLVSEWVMVSVVMLAMMLSYRMVLTLTLLPQPGLGMTLVQFLFSVLAYPVMVLALKLGLGLHKPGTGDGDRYGRRM